MREMPEWLSVALAVIAPILSVGATLMTVSFTAGGRFSRLEEQGRGYQAQLDRHERADSECEGKINAMRQEFADRHERLSSRITAHEQVTGSQNTALATALAELKATMSAMKEAIDRLAEAERTRQSAPQLAPAQPDLVSQLQQFAQLQKLLKSVGP
jgi:chromosome segregation ATPase